MTAARKARKRGGAPASFVVLQELGGGFAWRLVANNGAHIAQSVGTWPRMQSAADACVGVRDALRANDVPITLDARKPAPTPAAHPVD